MIRLLNLERDPLDLFTALRPSRIEMRSRAHIPLLVGTVEGLPDSVDALVCTSDLQFRVDPNGHSDANPEHGVLLGTTLPDALASDLACLLELDPERCVAVVAGDLYAHPLGTGKRGGYGDTLPVWRAFAAHFGEVVGVLGNHDLLDAASVAGPSDGLLHSEGPRLRVVDAGVIDVAGMRVGAVSGCVGNPARPFRFESNVQRRRIERVLDCAPELLVLHQGPPGTGRARPGAEVVEALLENATRDGRAPSLCICGHEAWTDRAVAIGGTTVLNVHEAVVVLRGVTSDSA